MCFISPFLYRGKVSPLSLPSFALARSVAEVVGSKSCLLVGLARLVLVRLLLKWTYGHLLVALCSLVRYLASVAEGRETVETLLV